MSLLSQPAHIGKMRLKNRMVMAPMGVTIGNMTEATVAYFVERARGGAAMVVCNVMGSGRFESTEHSIFFNEETERLFAQLVEACHRYDCKVCAQIMTGVGRAGGPSLLYPVPVSASPCEWKYAPGVSCHQLTVEEIHALVDDYRKSAESAVRAGADAIEVHAYGGYLTDQFLTAAWNTRQDEYGGTLEKRARFLKELIDVCKAAGGTDFPVLVKYTPDHYVEADDGHRKMEEGIALTHLIEGFGADALHVDAGCYENWYYAMPPAAIQEMTLQARSAKVIKQVSHLPVLTHGRFSDVEKAEAALRNGVCDIAVIGRGLLADPELPNKVLEKRIPDIRPCISCNEGCIGRVCAGKPATCAVNPRCGFEDGSRDIPPAKIPLKILVVGAGPGGCAAALYAKQAGHQVEIWEKGLAIGGSARFAAEPYFKLDMHRLLNYLTRQLERCQIPVRLDTEATPEAVQAYHPDRLIWAAGGRQLRPSAIPGLDGPAVYPAAEALRNLCDVGDRVVVVGGGMVGVETALHLDRMGKEVTLLEMADRIPPEPGFIMNEELLQKQMRASHVVFRPETCLRSVESGLDGSRIRAEFHGRQEEIPCDTVLLAMGAKPTAEQALQDYRGICPVFCIGDSFGSRKIIDAIHDAYEAVRNL